MIQKEKIRGVGYFLMALVAGLPPFAAPEPQRPPMRPHRREEYDPDEV